MGGDGGNYEEGYERHKYEETGRRLAMVKRERRNADSMHSVVNKFSGFVAGGGMERNIRDKY